MANRMARSDLRETAAAEGLSRAFAGKADSCCFALPVYADAIPVAAQSLPGSGRVTNNPEVAPKTGYFLFDDHCPGDQNLDCFSIADRSLGRGMDSVG